MNSLSSIIYSAPGNLIRLFCVLCFFASTAVFAIVIRQKRDRLTGVLSIIHFVFIFFFLVAVLDGTYGKEFFPEPRKWFPFVSFLYSLPWIITVLMCLISCVISVLFFINSYRFSRIKVQKSAIKESVDQLPAGICFGNTTERIVFTNLKMLDFSRRALGVFFKSTGDMWKAICSRGEEYGESFIIAPQKGKAYLFSRSTIDYFGSEYTQITAFDVSTRYSVTLAFREKQKLLLDIQNREKQYSKDVARLVTARERLFMNANFHDEIGHLLLRGRYHFEHPDNDNREELKKFITDTNKAMFGERDEEYSGDTYIDAITLADTIGVTVRADGNPPENKSVRELIARAVHECSVNLVKHAGGDTLFVNFSDDGKCFSAVFKNNGNPPAEPVAESGGLLSLRKMVESKNGRMLVESEPDFSLTINLPSSKRIPNH